MTEAEEKFSVFFIAPDAFNRLEGVTFSGYSVKATYRFIPDKEGIL